MDEYTIRSIVRSEIAAKDIWTTLFGNPQMNYAISNHVNTYLDRNLQSRVDSSVKETVSQATKNIQIDGISSINSVLNNDKRVQHIINESVYNIQQMITSEIDSGIKKLKSAADTEITNVIREDRYNSINEKFLSDLKKKCEFQFNGLNSMISLELSKYSQTHENYVKELDSKCSELSTIKKDIKTLKDQQPLLIASSLSLGTLIGASAIYIMTNKR